MNRLQKLAIGILMALVSGCGSRPGAEATSVLATADRDFETANNANDYVRVAARYQEVIDSGFVSAEIYFNQGNAWAQAGDYGRAILSYLRSLEINPRDDHVLANLDEVRSRCALPSSNSRSFADTVFFLNRYFSETELSVAASILLACALICMNIALARRNSRSFSRGGWILSVAFVVLAAAIAYQWYEQSFFPVGVVVEETPAYLGPADSYDPAFSQSLNPGTEFHVLGMQNEWLNIEVPGAGEAWIVRRVCGLVIAD